MTIPNHTKGPLARLHHYCAKGTPIVEKPTARTTYHLEVYGIAWGGFTAHQQYTVGSARAMILKGLDRPTQLDAGDFQDILNWRLVEESNEFEQVSHGLDRRIDTFKTLRGFRNGMKPQRFHRLINGY